MWGSLIDNRYICSVSSFITEIMEVMTQLKMIFILNIPRGILVLPQQNQYHISWRNCGLKDSADESFS